MIEWMITSSLLIVTVLLLRRVLRGRISMGLQYALWGLVLLRLLIPGTVASSRVSVMNVLPQEPAALLSEPVEDQSFMPEDQGAADPVGGNLQPSVSQNAGDQSAGVVQAPQSGAAGQTASNRPDNDSGRAWTIGKILRAVWLTGVGGMGLWMLMGNLRFARRLRRMRVPAEGKRHVYVAAALPSPCLYGLYDTQVGPDTVGGDFFENVETYAQRAQAEAERLEEEERLAREKAEAERQAQLEAQAEAERIEREQKAARRRLWMGLAAGGLAAIVCVVLVVYLVRRRRKR